MVLHVLFKLMYPPFITALSVMGFAGLTNTGWNEIKGKHLQYSKLRNSSAKQQNKGVGGDDGDAKKTTEKAKVGGKLAMFVVYTPALIAGVSSFFLYPSGNLRFTLLRSAVTLHFLKRVLEVLFVHKYSGYMDVQDMIVVTQSYFIFSATTIYTQSLTLDLPEPAFDLKFIGAPLFLLGISGNLYHHYLLSKLRSKGEKQYKIPKGGLFGLVVCPHYLFEILDFCGISCIAQTLYPLCYSLGTMFYLTGRSYATREWYRSKFEDFPKDVKALVPYVF